MKPRSFLVPTSLACLAMTACLDAGTGGRAITIDFAVTSAPAQDRALGVFDTADGWRVSLQEAHVALGPVYLFENPGALSTLARLPSALSHALIPAAHAHAGDNQFAGGAVLGELAEFLVVDALSEGAQRFEDRAAVFGAPRSFSLRLPAEPITQGAPLQGHQAFVRGTATRNDESVCFLGGATPESDARRDVSGLPFAGTLDDGVTVNLTLYPHAWLESARLDDVTATDSEGCLVITEGDAVSAAWSAALRSAASFSASVSTP
jgi:hypothetical protein